MLPGNSPKVKASNCFSFASITFVEKKTSFIISVDTYDAQADNCVYFK